MVLRFRTSNRPTTPTAIAAIKPMIDHSFIERKCGIGVVKNRTYKKLQMNRTATYEE
jgi:hypothetical protein